MQLVNGQASKALVAVLTTVAAALPIYYGTAKWVPVVVMALGALSVYLVPNADAPQEKPSLILQRGGYSAGSRTVSDLPPPPPSVTAEPGQPPASGLTNPCPALPRMSPDVRGVFRVPRGAGLPVSPLGTAPPPPHPSTETGASRLKR